jgi:phosphoribosylanthranilate isomerase
MCGFTRPEDVRAAVDAGADALGFVLTPSPRRVSPSLARALVRDVPPHILRVGVFVDEVTAEIANAAAAADLDRVQVHRADDPMLRDLFGTRLLVAFRARDDDVLDAIRDHGADTFLLDTYSPDLPGGTGRTFDWSLALRARDLGRLVLAGGLTPENVGRAVREIRPFGVDVSSGIEDAPGSKNAEAMRAFVRAVRDADRELDGSMAPERGRRAR